MTIAYLVNQYPQPSQTFIRREIAALEDRGLTVHRFTLRGWAGPLADAADAAERQRTRAVLGGRRGGPAGGAAGDRRGPAPTLRPGSGHGVASRPTFGAGHAGAPGLPGRGLPAAPLAGRGRRRPPARPLRHQLGRRGDAVPACSAAPRTASPCTAPRSSTPPRPCRWGRRSARAAFAVAVSDFGRSQLYRWAEHRRLGQAPRRPLRRRRGLPRCRRRRPPPAAPRLVCVGRLAEQKGQLLLVEAAARLRDRGRRLRARPGRRRPAARPDRATGRPAAGWAGRSAWPACSTATASAARSWRRGRWCCRASPRGCRSS